MAAPDALDPTPDVSPAKPAARTGPPREPEEIVAEMLGGAFLGDFLSKKVLIALSQEGWCLAHPTRPGELIRYGHKVEGA